MRVLHILDHSLPIHSGYAFRSAEIIRHQSNLGWDVMALTGPKHNVEGEKGLDNEDFDYQRASYSKGFRSLPSIAQQVHELPRHPALRLAATDVGPP